MVGSSSLRGLSGRGNNGSVAAKVPRKAHTPTLSHSHILAHGEGDVSSPGCAVIIVRVGING